MRMRAETVHEKCAICHNSSIANEILKPSGEKKQLRSLMIKTIRNSLRECVGLVDLEVAWVADDQYDTKVLSYLYLHCEDISRRVSEDFRETGRHFSLVSTQKISIMAGLLVLAAVPVWDRCILGFLSLIVAALTDHDWYSLTPALLDDILYF
jgi:hypothetical protein